MNSLARCSKKHKGTLLCLLQFAVLGCTGQLNISDTCPDLSFSTVINMNSVKLSDYKGKALIIDFWDTRCHSCIEGFPVIDSLQKKFRNKVQIISVTKQDRKTIEAFFSRFRKIKAPDVPLITGDTALSTLFPSDGYPYVVWMDSARIVKYFTTGYNMTSEHLEKFLDGRKLNVKAAGKKTMYTPLWHLEDSVLMRNVKYFSALATCIDGVDIHIPDNELKDKEDLVQVSSNCSTLLALIQQAFSENGKYPVYTKYGLEIHMDSNLLFEPSDPNKWDDWMQDHLFNYQLILPASKKRLLYKTMQLDLQIYFDLRVRWIKKKVKGYELVPLGNTAIPKSKSKVVYDAYNNGDYATEDTLSFTNQPLERLIFLLNAWMGYSVPFRSLIHKQEKIDFNIAKSSIAPLNVEALNRDLRPLHLHLKQTEIEADILIVASNK